MKHFELSAIPSARREAERVREAITKKAKRTRTRLQTTFRKKRNQRRAIYAGSASIIMLLFVAFTIQTLHVHKTAEHFNNVVQQKDTQLTEHQAKTMKLQSDLKEVQQQKAVTDTQLQEKAKAEADMKAQIDKLNQEVQSKREQQATDIQLASAVVTPAPVEAAPAPVAAPADTSSGCGDNFYANFIYTHESGCSTSAVNAGGCTGIGQDCNGVLIAKCGYSYACQNEYFSSYASSRYGGWAGAYAFWTAHGWW